VELEPTISEVTRRAIADYLSTCSVPWCGRFEEQEFLSRLYNLTTLPSSDSRFTDAASDIWQHRERNQDWERDWVFYDRRFRLLNVPDDEFLQFLCETVHPIVRPNTTEARVLVAKYNELLRPDSWEIAEHTALSGKPVFAARRIAAGVAPILAQARTVASELTDYVSRQITRMEASLNNDPDLAIGTAKEFLETICKTVLAARGSQLDPSADLPVLMKATLACLPALPSTIGAAPAAERSVKALLSSLGQIAQRLSELRNRFGTGHGRHPSTSDLEHRHAKLAINAAIALGVFIYESHEASQ
jgi:AbiJ N-terminal domain 3/Abortive infection C-terminus